MYGFKGIYFMISLFVRYLLMHELKSSRYYFEYGCGGSTLIAARLIEAFNLSLTISSVDSSPSWIDQIKNDTGFQELADCFYSFTNCFILTVISKLSLSEQFSAHYINIGDIGNWGMPTNRSYESYWPKYSESIWHYGRDADIVLVDGRFRVACALNAVLLSFTPPHIPFSTISAYLSNFHRPVPKNLHSNRHQNHSTSTSSLDSSHHSHHRPAFSSVPRNITIMMHDFARSDYHKVLEYTTVVHCVDTLVVLRPNLQVDFDKLKQDIHFSKIEPHRP